MSRTRGPRSSHHNGDRSDESPAATCTSGTHASTIHSRLYWRATSADPARRWSRTSTCRRSGHPRRSWPRRSRSLQARLAHVPLDSPCCRSTTRPCQLLPQRSHDRLSIGRVLAGLVLVATDDVRRPLDVDLLDILKGEGASLSSHLGCTTRYRPGWEKHLVPDLASWPRIRAPRMYLPPAVLLQRLDRLLADHAPIGHDADPADPEAGSEAIGHGNQCRHVGRVAGQQLAADRPACPSSTAPTIICRRSGRWSLL